MRLVIRITLILLLFPASLAAVAGWLAAPVFLHPVPHPLTSELICEADASSISAGARREDFDVRAGDGSLLRGWKVRAANPMGTGS